MPPKRPPKRARPPYSTPDEERRLGPSQPNRPRAGDFRLYYENDDMAVFEKREDNGRITLQAFPRGASALAPEDMLRTQLNGNDWTPGPQGTLISRESLLSRPNTQRKNMTRRQAQHTEMTEAEKKRLMLR